MSARVAVAILVIFPLIFAGVGAGFGWLIGAFLPGYYRAVIVNSDAPGFDPLEVGIGLGMTQGFGGGIVLGIAIVAILAWRDVQLEKLKSPGDPR